MKKKLGFFLGTMLLVLLGMCGNVFAANENITIEKTVTSYEQFNINKGGEIKLTVKGITLKENHTYQYRIYYNELNSEWHEIENIDLINNTMTIVLENNKQDIVNILKLSDKAYITIYEIAEDATETEIMGNKEIDISLPLSKAFKVGHWVSGYHGIAHTYNIQDIYFKYVKVGNEEIIKKYLEYLKTQDSKDEQYWGYYVDDLIDTIVKTNEIPTTDDMTKLIGRDTNIQPDEEGLYYIWIKAPKTSNNKELIGCVFSKRFNNNSVLEEQLKKVQQDKLQLTATISYDPNTETIGVVTATIKTNKKVNQVKGWTLSEEGMTLTKTYAENANETVYLVDTTGMTKDVEVKVTNIVKPEQTPVNVTTNVTSTPSPTNVQTPSGNIGSSSDTTAATGRLPQTGIGIETIVSILVVLAISIVCYKKCYDYKDIK